MSTNNKLIYLIRHGETEYNKMGIVQGSNVDTSLNETGKMQAQMFYNKYKTIKFDKIYTSKLKRTHESVAPFTNLGIPWEQYEGLNEISWGAQDGKVSNKDVHDYYLKISAQWAAGELDVQIGGGETPNQVMNRQIPVVKTILSRANEHTILICMHGRAMRILLCHIQNLPLSLMDTFEHSNLCLYILQYDGSKIKAITQNDTSHLALP
ncbi:MAG: histidine phosphatase family protein [Cytophagales bacterium]|nr:histidine phosphatase family protein [Cytophagales bacterium]